MRKPALTIITKGAVVLPDRIDNNLDIIIENGRISELLPRQAWQDSSAWRIIDASGCYVTCGFIDIHSDNIETIASPRPSVVMDLGRALYEADRLLASHGVTTIYHSLSLYDTQIFAHKPIRNFENVSRLIGHIAAMRAHEGSDHLIRHRLHLRIELDAVDRFEEIDAYLREGQVDLLSFMDHTPGQGQYRDIEVFAKTIKSYQGELSDEVVAGIVRQQQDAAKLAFEEIQHLAGMAHQAGIAIASHDDDSEEKLDFNEGIGAVISEFPISLELAKSARARGMHAIAGAPNIVMGFSHSGNLSARKAVCEGGIDILCSDYYPAGLVRAVFVLHHECGLALHEAFALLTCNPAQAVGIFDEVGSIAQGKKADLLLVRERDCALHGTTIPIVEAVFVEGRQVFRTSYPG